MILPLSSKPEIDHFSFETYNCNSKTIEQKQNFEKEHIIRNNLFRLKISVEHMSIFRMLKLLIDMLLLAGIIYY